MFRHKLKQTVYFIIVCAGLLFIGFVTNHFETFFAITVAIIFLMFFTLYAIVVVQMIKRKLKGGKK